MPRLGKHAYKHSGIGPQPNALQRGSLQRTSKAEAERDIFIPIPMLVSAMTRNLRIDTLRGLACILLVAFHVVGGANHGLLLPPDHILSRINSVLIYLRMPLFCFLSGIVYAWRPYNGEPAKFIKAKVRRLLVPMLLVGTLFAVLQSLTPGVNSKAIAWQTLHIIPVAHYWFLESLFIVFMVTAVLEKARLLTTPARFLAVWAGAVMLFMFNDPPVYFGLSGAVYLLPFFLLGLACKRFEGGLQRLNAAWPAVAIAAIALYVWLTRAALPEWNSLSAVLLGGAACLLLVRLGLQAKWLAWVGYFSFSIYLFHTMFSAASRIALIRLGVDNIALLFSLGLLAGIMGPIVASLVLKRMPMGHWVLGESRKAPAQKPGLVNPAPTASTQ